jgi:hypothetical protein
MDIDFGATRAGEVEQLLITKTIFLIYGLLVPLYLHGVWGGLLFVTFMVATGYPDVMSILLISQQ